MKFAAFPAALFLCLLPAALFLCLVSHTASADMAKGAKVYKKCVACHTIEKGGANKTGPNLFGIVNGAVAGRPDYKYSAALKKYGGEWSPERLDEFLTKPRKAIKGTRMSFAGLKKEKDRANLIAYLAVQSDTPLEVSGNTSAPTAETKDESEFGLMKVADGVETTFYACTACHSEMIVVQQGLTRDGWDELIDWMIEDQGMDEPDTADRDIMLNYLAAHYNEDRPNRPVR